MDRRRRSVNGVGEGDIGKRDITAAALGTEEAEAVFVKAEGFDVGGTGFCDEGDLVFGGGGVFVFVGVVSGDIPGAGGGGVRAEEGAAAVIAASGAFVGAIGAEKEDIGSQGTAGGIAPGTVQLLHDIGAEGAFVQRKSEVAQGDKAPDDGTLFCEGTAAADAGGDIGPVAAEKPHADERGVRGHGELRVLGDERIIGQEGGACGVHGDMEQSGGDLIRGIGERGGTQQAALYPADAVGTVADGIQNAGPAAAIGGGIAAKERQGIPEADGGFALRGAYGRGAEGCAVHRDGGRTHAVDSLPVFPEGKTVSTALESGGKQINGQHLIDGAGKEAQVKIRKR